MPRYRGNDTNRNHDDNTNNCFPHHYREYNYRCAIDYKFFYNRSPFHYYPTTHHYSTPHDYYHAFHYYPTTYYYLTPTTTPPSTTTPPPTTTTKPPTTTQGFQPARIIQPPKDIMAYVGTEVLFRCRATGFPTPAISWRKGPIPVSSLVSNRIQMLANGDLRVADITEEDNDVYTCIATNFVGPMDTKEARLAVIVQVSVSVSPNNATASPGDDVKITCTSRGKPRPAVEWYKDDSFISSQGRMRVSRTSVIITQVQPSDSGYYQCQARHNYGSASDKMYLNVIDKKEPTEPPFKCEDNPFIAHCQVVRQVNYCCIPYYQKACCKTCEDLLPDCNN